MAGGSMSAFSQERGAETGLAWKGGKESEMSYNEPNDPAPAPLELRERAVKQLSKRRDFRVHALVYVAVNAFLVVIWAVTIGPDGFFWPIFAIGGWAIGLVAHWYDAYRGGEFGEEAIQHEMDRLAHLH